MTTKEKKERGKIELKIEAKNFGPISGGKITLKPLTIFIGPNNSGKSYAAMLIHSVFESYMSYIPILPRLSSRDISLSILPRFLSESRDIRAFLKEFSDLVPDLKRQIDNLKEGEKLEITKELKELIEKATNKIFEDIYEERLSGKIFYLFSCPLNELIRIGERSFALKINFNSYGTHLTCQKDKLKIKEYPQLNIRIIIKATESSRLEIYEINEKGEEVLIDMVRLWREKEESEFIYIELIDLIFNICTSKISENLAALCYYLPAARSGILQGHRALMASMVKEIPYVGVKRLEIPRLSGVVADFIFSVINLPERKGPFYELARDFEEELIRGEIVVRALEEYRYPEIKYKFQNTEIPLHRASSTVSELAPLFLYLKYIIEPNSILIIEEPEAHLHPANQRILAKFLVKLIRENVHIIITTHSEYILEQLSSFIQLSKVEPKERVQRYKYNEEDFLKADEVAAYVFEYDNKSGGYKTAEVEITEEEGISQEEFIKINEALYEEIMKLRRDLITKT